jgi:hypothetical protein
VSKQKKEQQTGIPSREEVLKLGWRLWAKDLLEKYGDEHTRQLRMAEQAERWVRLR